MRSLHRRKFPKFLLATLLMWLTGANAWGTLTQDPQGHYQIYNVDNFIQYVTDIKTGTADICNDIDLSTYNNGNWEPLSNGGDLTIHGHGHTISNLKCGVASAIEKVGLFASVKTLIVDSLTITVDQIKGSYPYYLNSTKTIGGEAGAFATKVLNSANFEYCYVKPSNNSVETNIQGYLAGGFVGSSEGTLVFKGCGNYVSVKSYVTEYTVRYRIGGFVGEANSVTFRHCYNIGSVTGEYTRSANGGYAGGFVGKPSDITAEYCYNNGEVSSNSSQKSGQLFSKDANASSKINECYSSNSVALENTQTYLLGSTDFKSGKACDLLNRDPNLKFHIWKQTLGSDNFPVTEVGHKTVYAVKEGDYRNDVSGLQPEFYKQYTEDGINKHDGSFQPAENNAGVYQITNCGNLMWFAQQVNSGKYPLHAELVNDLDFGGFTCFPIGTATIPFRGSFNGNGHTIRGINIEGNDFLGLFSTIGNSKDKGEVSNLTLAGCRISGREYVGVLAGYVAGNSIISECTITHDDKYSNSYVNASQYAGLLIGDMVNGTVSRCVLKNGGFGPEAQACKTSGFIGLMENGRVEYCMDVATYFLGKGFIGQMNKGAKLFSSYSINKGVYSSEGTIDRFYFNGSGVNGTYKSEEQFANGEVTWLLNGGDETEDAVWRQGGSRPTLGNGEIVHMKTVCDGKVNVYYITTEPSDHVYDVTGVCTRCHAYQPAERAGYICYISNAGQLMWFAQQYNAGELRHDTRAKLMNDITLTEAWTPIASYKGLFDGNSKTINGLTISGNGNTGFIARLDSIGCVKNLTLANCDVEYTGTYVRNSSVGALVGFVSSTKASIEKCSVSGSVKGQPNYIGGIVGSSVGTIKNCCSFATVDRNTTDKTYDGLIAGSLGESTASITNCFAYVTDRMTDPLVGYNPVNAAVTNCFRLTEYSGTDEADNMSAEAFANGRVTWLLNGKTDQKIVWKQDRLYPSLYVGDTVHYGLICDGKTETYYVGDNKHDFGEGHYCSKCGVSNAEPAFNNGVYEISTEAELFWFAQFVNKGGDNQKANAKLMNNITLTKEWVPIAGYRGVFNGNGHIISNLLITNSQNLWKGFIGRLYGTVHSLQLEACEISITGTNAYKVGAVAGSLENGASIYKCAVITKISTEYASSDTYSTVNVDTEDESSAIGGLVGYCNGSIKNCYSLAFVTAKIGKTGSLVGSVGQNATINSCFAFNEYQKGKAICGDNLDKFTNCYYLSNEETNDGGRTGYWFYAYVDVLNNGRTKNQVWKSVQGSHPNLIFPTVDETFEVDEEGYAIIRTADDLKKLANFVNTENTEASAKLVKNIDLTGINWTPIGTSSNNYYGVFNGDNHTVSGLSATSSTGDVVGLFGNVVNATIKNLTVEGMVSGGEYAGGIVGFANRYTVIKNCVNKANVYSKFSEAKALGGIVGYCEAITISNCSNYGLVSSPTAYNIGGIAGYGEMAEKCMNYGSVVGNVRVGGIMGWCKQRSGQEFALNACANFGDITSGGGLAGNFESGAKIMQCYNYSEVSNKPFYNSESGTVTVNNCYYKTSSEEVALAEETAVLEEDFNSGKVAYLLNQDSESPVWFQTIGTDNYPVLSGDTVYSGYKHGSNELSYTNTHVGYHSKPDSIASHNATLSCNSEGLLACDKCGKIFSIKKENDIYLISNADELDQFRIITTINPSVNGQLTKDIYLNELGGAWEPIGRDEEDKHYTGTFNGDNHTIYGLLIDDAVLSTTGLFGAIKNSTIKNLTVEGKITSGVFAGGIVGYADEESTIENCVNNVEISTDGGVIGGICGFFIGSEITNCSNFALINNTGNTGKYMFNAAGGIAGYATKAKKCINNGTVAAINSYGGGIMGICLTEIISCANIGYIGTNNGNSYDVGGLVGLSQGTKISYSFNYGKVLIMDGLETTNGAPINGAGSPEIIGCYALTAVDADHPDISSATEASFTSGKVAYGLNGGDTTENAVWRQELVEGSLYPVLSGEIVYGVYKHGETEMSYSNTTKGFHTEADVVTDGEHSHEAEVEVKDNVCHCKVCGAEVEARLIYDEDGVCLIYNADQLVLFRNGVNSGKLASTNAKLMDDIDLSNVCNSTKGSWEPIGSNIAYKGIFNGNGKTIKALYINIDKDAMGLFSYCSKATIMNLIVDGFIKGNNTVGGIVAQTSSASSIENCVNMAEVSGVSGVGGIVGEVSQTSLSNCANIGKISGNEYVGGLIGNSRSCKPKFCYNYGEVSSNSPIYGGGAVSNLSSCFYKAEQDVDYKNVTYATAKSEKEFASGEVAYLLNAGNTTDSVWRQTIGTDLYPVFTGNIVKKVGTASNPCFLNEANPVVTKLSLSENEPLTAVDGMQVVNISYGRTVVKKVGKDSVAVAAKWGTLCLPFDFEISSNTTSKTTFFQVDAISNDAIQLRQLSGKVEAGTPVIYYATEDKLNITATNIVINATVKSTEHMTGSFSNKTVQADEEEARYYLKDNMFMKTASSFILNAYRAYFFNVGTASAGGEVATKSLRLVLPDDGVVEDTNEEGIDLNELAIETIYNVSGQRVSDIRKNGVYILKMSDGTSRKVVIK